MVSMGPGKIAVSTSKGPDRLRTWLPTWLPSYDASRVITRSSWPRRRSRLTPVTGASKWIPYLAHSPHAADPLVPSMSQSPGSPFPTPPITPKPLVLSKWTPYGVVEPRGIGAVTELGKGVVEHDDAPRRGNGIGPCRSVPSIESVHVDQIRH